MRRIDNQLDVLSKTFLGLTLACARCHDHKFDPITAQDYYAMAGYLASSRHQQAFIDPPERIGKFVNGLRAAKDKVVAILTEARDQLPEPLSEPGLPPCSASTPAQRAVTRPQPRRSTTRACPRRLRPQMSSTAGS